MKISIEKIFSNWLYCCCCDALSMSILWDFKQEILPDFLEIFVTPKDQNDDQKGSRFSLRICVETPHTLPIPATPRPQILISWLSRQQFGKNGLSKLLQFSDWFIFFSQNRHFI